MFLSNTRQTGFPLRALGRKINRSSSRVCVLLGHHPGYPSDHSSGVWGAVCGVGIKYPGFSPNRLGSHDPSVPILRPPAPQKIVFLALQDIPATHKSLPLGEPRHIPQQHPHPLGGPSLQVLCWVGRGHGWLEARGDKGRGARSPPREPLKLEVTQLPGRPLLMKLETRGSANGSQFT